jgi:phage terminase large subunit-like protein
MIIAVNISKVYNGNNALQATERAWDLDIEKCREHDYVIGVIKGQIKCCFKLNDVNPDSQFPERVKFELEQCSDEVEQNIRSYIRDNDINLGGVQRGKYI